LGGMIMVKRLQRMRNRDIRIISDNDRYETEIVTDEEAVETLTVNARVVWSGGPLR
jgi:phage repressor protein C with HTH and peptisase S24 domain